MLFGSDGNIRIADFGCAKDEITSAVSGGITFCGTPEYVAPEIVMKKPHGRAVDWWSLGALLFEMLTGLPPFYCRNRDEMFEKIVSGSMIFPKFMSKNARDILTKLLNRDAKKRLGSADSDGAEVRAHPFFQTMDWDALLQNKLTPPWVPKYKGENSTDTSEFDPEFTSMPLGSLNIRAAEPVAVVDPNFSGFSFIDENVLQGMSSSLRSFNNH